MKLPTIEARRVSKNFPGVRALDDVTFAVRPGEVIGLVGENGSGKSTLLKILAGRESPTSGELVVDGEAATFSSPAQALGRGVALVAQEIHVQDHLSVAENLLEGRLPKRLGLIDWGKAAAEAGRILSAAGMARINPQRRAGELALHDQQMISILKVVERRPRVVLFDEPTSSLTAAEVDQLYGLIARLKADGCAIVYITHRLHEYFDLTDRVVVLRDGRIVAEQVTVETDENRLVTQMVGREVGDLFARQARNSDIDRSGVPILEVRALTTRSLRAVELSVHPGEIVGIAGQAGSGRTSLAGTLFGRWSYTGEVRVDGRVVRLRNPGSAIKNGIALVPEDRRREGLVGTMSVTENLVMPSWPTGARYGVRRPRTDRALADKLRRDYGVRSANRDVHVASLSGGNQQKIVIAKWAPRDVRVLILDEPTRGVDVGAKAEIYRMIEEQAAAGVAVIVMSSELLEVMRLADRVVVMAAGRVVGSMDGAEATEESITAMAFAADKHAAKVSEIAEGAGS